jgi:hypothetical protein
MEDVWKVLTAVVERALRAVGTFAALCAVATWGVVMTAVDPSPAWIALTVFGLAGALESWHRQREAELMKRRQLPSPDDVIVRALDAHPKWRGKVFEEFEYGGVKFRVVGFQEVPFPLTVTQPLCPRCEGHLAERRETRFPGRSRILHRCRCGFSCYRRRDYVAVWPV